MKRGFHQAVSFDQKPNSAISGPAIAGPLNPSR